jgi:ASC-1-like (ASCH) protein
MKKKYILRFREENRDIFQAIKKGKKRVETRAATIRYHKIMEGDEVTLLCGKDKFNKMVKRAYVFKTIMALLKKYTPTEIHPHMKTHTELTKLYYSFPGYKEKIRKNGLIALELE